MSNISGLASVAKEGALKRAAARKLGTQKKYKGKYAGPDKYKGEIPEHLKSKYKGKYFGKEAGKGANPIIAKPKSAPQASMSNTLRTQVMPTNWKGGSRYASAIKASRRLKTDIAAAKANTRSMPNSDSLMQHVKDASSKTAARRFTK